MGRFSEGEARGQLSLLGTSKDGARDGAVGGWGVRA